MNTSPEDSSVPGLVHKHEVFVTTQWSLVLRAGDQTSEQADSALARLCQDYWYPLYAYVRRRGYSPEDAADLTQEFFRRVLERNWIARADPTKGRFRSFLLASMNHFLSDAWDKARAQKRGGNAVVLPLDSATAETRFSREPADPATPDELFERRWALTLLETVLNRLRDEYERDGRLEMFQALSPCLVGDCTAQPYAVLAESLGVREGTVKAAVHRLRLRYRHLLRAQIAETVAAPEDVDEELHHLFSVLSRS